MFWMHSFEIVQPITSEREGMSYITSSIASSMTARKPRAPVPRAMASEAMACSASSVKSSLTPSISEELRVPLRDGVLRLGEDAHERRLVERIERSDDREAADELGNEAVAQQVFRLHERHELARVALLLALDLGAEARTFSPTRRSITLSRPSKAPPQMNRMSFVFTSMYFCCGCLRPPCGGTLATVPSRIFSSACCTPSPDTSRVMLGFSLLREILSISSM